MKTIAWLIGLVVFMELCVTDALATGAQEVPYWPSEREERLNRVESMIVGTMRKLTAARYEGRNVEAEQLVKDLEVLQSQEALLREPPLNVDSARR